MWNPSEGTSADETPRTPAVLTSGLDDYPRAVPPHLGELHLDLASWMGFFARTMRDVAEFLGEEEDYEEYEDQYEAIRANIEDLHWSEEEQMYCDASVDEDGEFPFHRDSRMVLLMLRYHRRIVPRLPPRLRLPLPLRALAPPGRLAPPRRDLGTPPRSRAPVVLVRTAVAQQVAPALWAGRELLARSDLDPDELPRARRAAYRTSLLSRRS